MAYRTYVKTTGKNDIQLLGNNEYYQPFIDELKRQGYYVDNDYCYGVEFKDDDLKDKCIPIKEIQPIIDVLEQYIWDEDKRAKEFGCDIFDLRPNEIDKKDLTSKMLEIQDCAYIFVTSNLINYLKENLDTHYDVEKHRITYKIKEGKEVYFMAY